MKARRDRLIVAIGVFKLVKAALLIAVGVCGLAALPAQDARAADRLVAWMGVAPGRHMLERVSAELAHMRPATAHGLAALAFAYAAVFLTEGIGLLSGKRWAEWLTVVVTASFIPIEIYESVRHFGAGKVAALVINVAILVYLIWRRVQARTPVGRAKELSRKALATVTGS